MTRRRQSCRRLLDEWHGTIVRYAGIGLLIYSVAVDRFRTPALLPAATGMIFYKNIVGGRNNGAGNGRGE